VSRCIANRNLAARFTQLRSAHDSGDRRNEDFDLATIVNWDWSEGLPYLFKRCCHLKVEADLAPKVFKQRDEVIASASKCRSIDVLRPTTLSALRGITLRKIIDI